MKSSQFVGIRGDPSGPSAQPPSAMQILVTLAGIPLCRVGRRRVHSDDLRHDSVKTAQEHEDLISGRDEGECSVTSSEASAYLRDGHGPCPPPRSGTAVYQEHCGSGCGPG